MCIRDSLSPDINLCHEDFTVVGDSIYYGLAALKNVGKEAIGKVIDERKTNGQYVSFYDLVKRNPEIDKKMLEALAKTGALDFTGYTRHTLMISGVEYLSAQKRASKKQIEGQLSLDVYKRQCPGRFQKSPEPLHCAYLIRSGSGPA